VSLDSVIIWRNNSASSNAVEQATSAEAHFEITFDVSLPEETISLVYSDFEAKIIPTVLNVINYPPVFEQPLEDIVVTVVQGTSMEPVEFLSPKIID
jgi:hypothetical protein